METELGTLNDLSMFLETLPEKLKKTPYDYSIYMQWVALLHATGNVKSLHVARQYMCLQMAIPEEVLLEWIANKEAQPGAHHDKAVLVSIVGLFKIGMHEQ
ncbi:hypothetical protein LPJ61_003071 [Coemansia biformis]|uniref:Uncharacterized protein n=1 Tax=Coemansia biformis TaxID=1286918 RepID=A0A9W7Y771_9FUNG|nr:hypothetical protein LPJ61_003071 [Coemansia biformis]